MEGSGPGNDASPGSQGGSSEEADCSREHKRGLLCLLNQTMKAGGVSSLSDYSRDRVFFLVLKYFKVCV